MPPSRSGRTLISLDFFPSQTIVHVGGQDFLVRGSDVDTVEAEARDMDDERALCKEPLSSVSEIHAENGQQESQELQNFPDVQEPARGQVSM